MRIHNSLSDFILFLYVHMSQADSSYDPAEMAVIKSKMSKLFSEGIDLEQKLYTTIRQYNSFDKSKLKTLFQETLTHFSQQEALQKNNVYEDLQEIIQADGKVDSDESKALDALKQMIDRL